MSGWMNLVDETIGHFKERARSVRAYTDEKTYIITMDKQGVEFIVTTQEPGFPKTKTKNLEQYFIKVFGIEARY